MVGPRVSSKAFTLIEAMLAISLIALAASLGAVGLASADRSARLDRAIAVALDADARARLLARGGESLRLGQTDVEGPPRLVIRAREESQWKAGVPKGIELAWIDPESGALLQGLIFDRSGACADYLLRARDEATSRLWRVNGLTGWAVQVREGPTP